NHAPMVARFSFVEELSCRLLLSQERRWRSFKKGRRGVYEKSDKTSQRRSHQLFLDHRIAFFTRRFLVCTMSLCNQARGCESRRATRYVARQVDKTCIVDRQDQWQRSAAGRTAGGAGRRPR